MDGKQALRRKPSTSSVRLQPPSRPSQSCPSSPRKNLRTTPSASSATLNEEVLPSTSNGQCGERSAPGLHRSPSSVSQYRQRSGPAGYYSYTNSSPPSRTNSRADLTEENKTGSVRIFSKGRKLYDKSKKS